MIRDRLKHALRQARHQSVSPAQVERETQCRLVKSLQRRAAGNPELDAIVVERRAAVQVIGDVDATIVALIVFCFHKISSEQCETRARQAHGIRGGAREKTCSRTQVYA